MTPAKRLTCSAIVINYNHASYLPNALDAALNQTVPFDEIIIVDDASTDHSVSLIQKRIDGISHARLIKNPQNLGIINTLNIGLREAKSDFIFIISADDRYSLRIVEWCHAALGQHPDVAMVTGNVRICNSDTGKERFFTLPFPQKLSRYTRQGLAVVARKRNMTFYGGGCLLNRKAALEAGSHLPALKWHADWFLYLVLACRYPFAVVPEEFAQIRQAGDQYSHACHDWKKQEPVIEAFIHTLKEDYPEEYGFFRNHALMPTYDIQAFFLLLKNKALRHYLTPLLAWRLLSYKPLRAVGRLLPDYLRAKVRLLLRV